MCNLLHHFSHHSIALNAIFTAYTLLSPTFPNCLSSLQQMEHTPSQVRNHYSQMNQEAHLERALAFNTAANLHCPSNVCISIMCLHPSYCRWLMSLISLVKENDDTDWENGHDASEDTGESTIWSNIEEDDFNHQLDVLHLGKVHQNNSLQTTRVPLLEKRNSARTIIAHPPLPNSRKPPGSMAPPLLKHHKSALLNKLSRSDHLLSAQVLPHLKSSGDQNAPQPQASA